MTKCTVPECPSNSSIHTTKYFRFPKDKAMARKWAVAIGLPNLEIKLHHNVCIKHFSDHFVIRTTKHVMADGSVIEVPNKRFQLHKAAHPTLFPDNPHKSKEASVPRTDPEDRRVAQMRRKAIANFIRRNAVNKAEAKIETDLLRNEPDDKETRASDSGELEIKIEPLANSESPSKGLTRSFLGAAEKETDPLEIEPDEQDVETLGTVELGANSAVVAVEIERLACSESTDNSLTRSFLENNKFCRICLTSSDDLLFIDMNDLLDASEKLTYLAYFEEMTKLDLHNDQLLAKSLCHFCACTLRDGYNTVQKAIQSDAVLKKICSKVESVPSTAPSPTPTPISDDHDYVCTEIETERTAQLEEKKVVLFTKQTTNSLLNPKVFRIIHKDGVRHAVPANVPDSELAKIPALRTLFPPSDPKTRKDKKKFVICEHCGKSYTSYCYKQHVVTHGEKTEKCTFPGCSYKTWFKVQLKAHAASVHSDERKFACSKCGKAFKLRSTLQSHQRLHATGQSFKCHICPATFKTSHYLRVHVRRHNPENKSKLCEICNVMVRRKTYRDHINTHIGATPYHCDKCPERFSTRLFFERHQRAEHSVKTEKIGRRNGPNTQVRTLEGGRKEVSYVCPFEGCGRSFSHSKTLIDHRYTHFRVSSFYCALCNKGLTSKIRLRRHMRILHQIEVPQSEYDAWKRVPLEEAIAKQAQIDAEGGPRYRGKPKKRLNVTDETFSESQEEYEIEEDLMEDVVSMVEDLYK